MWIGASLAKSGVGGDGGLASATDAASASAAKQNHPLLCPSFALWRSRNRVRNELVAKNLKPGQRPAVEA